MTTQCFEIKKKIPHFKDKTLVVFRESGGFWIYYLGIAKYMQEHYDISSCVFLGHSSGAEASYLLANNIPIDQIVDNYFEFVKQINSSWFGVFGNWCRMSQAFHLNQDNWDLHDKYTDNDTNDTNNTNNSASRLWYGVALWSSWFGFSKRYVCFNHGVGTGIGLFEAMIESCVTSYWIPFITAPFMQPFKKFASQWYVDSFWAGKDKTDHPKEETLMIHASKFKRYSGSYHWLWTSPEHNRKMYQAGYADAKAKPEIFDKFLQKIKVN